MFFSPFTKRKIHSVQIVFNQLNDNLFIELTQANASNAKKLIENGNYTKNKNRQGSLDEMYVNVISFNILVLVMNFCSPMLNICSNITTNIN